MTDRSTARRAHYEANRGQQIAAARAWAAANPEKVKATHAAHRAANPEYHAARAMVSKARARAEKSGVPFDAEYFTVAQITAWLRVHRGCECCSRAFEYGKRERIGPHPNSATLDRVRPERGYVQGNVALLCWRCNRIKSDATPDELERIAAWVRRRLR